MDNNVICLYEFILKHGFSCTQQGNIDGKILIRLQFLAQHESYHVRARLSSKYNK
jgi:hypothetical protein